MNGMYVFYLIALIPVIIGFLLYLFTKRINIQEWIFGTIIAFVISAIMHVCAYFGMVTDTEIWSGKVVEVAKYPFWIEEYQEAIYRTSLEPRSHFSNGKVSIRLESVRRFSHYETRHRNHEQYFTKTIWFGAESKINNICEADYIDIANKFGNEIKTINANRKGFDGGDNNYYVCINKTGYCIPATTIKNFTNKIKASPSSFSFKKVPEDAPVFEYPKCKNMWVSDRLLGDAANKISILEFDKLNSELGPTKEVNIIIIGFNNADSKLGKIQESKYLGGKKNDVIICYGYAPLEGNIPNICWTYCFSYCKNEQMKRNIENIFKNYPIDDTILPLIKKEILSGYQRRNWSEMDLITVKPRPVHYIFLLITTFIIQGIFWAVTLNNDFNK